MSIPRLFFSINPIALPGAAGTHFFAMETVIILKGPGGRGKTQTLKILIDNLIAADGASVVYPNDGVPCGKADYFVIIDLPGYGRVGVITYGDSGCEQSVSNALAECVNHDCRAVIGASRTRGSNRRPTVYSILRDFGGSHNAKTVETSTIVSLSAPGTPINTRDLNVICARNLETLLLHI